MLTKVPDVAAYIVILESVGRGWSVSVHAVLHKTPIPKTARTTRIMMLRLCMIVSSLQKKPLWSIIGKIYPI